MSHWYQADGTPMHFVPCKSRPGETRPTTIADARKLSLVPGVTTVLNVLRKPALEKWLVMQGVLAVLTAPPKKDEDLDAFVDRVLNQEKQQDQESQIAKDRGSEIHAALESWFSGGQRYMLPWIEPVACAIEAYGKVHACEKILVGEGYAGKTDLILELPDCFWILDYKTTKKLPDKGAWNEHKIQASAYANALHWTLPGKPIHTGNVYISTVDCGKFIIHEHEPWPATYANAFLPLLTVWKWLNNM